MLNASFFLSLLFFPEVGSLTRLGCEQDLHSLNLAPGGLLIFLKFIYFIYLFLAALVLRCCVRLSLVVASEGYSSLRCAGFLLQWLLLLRIMGSRRVGFSSCGAWAQQLWRVGSVVVVHGLSCSAACGIFPDWGLNPCPLHWQADS